MSAPLVSVSGVLESEMVSTKQPTERGAWALCSLGTTSARHRLAGDGHAGARGQVELPAVKRAGHDGALDEAVGEVAALMRAGIADGEDLVAAVEERHVLALDAHQRSLPGRERGQVQHLHAGHPVNQPPSPSPLPPRGRGDWGPS